MTKNKILITGTSVRVDLLQPLLDAGFEIENPTNLLTENELKKHLRTSTGYLLGGDEFASRDALSAADNLKVIAFLGVGYQSFVDVEAANEKGIPITNTPGTLSNSVAEFTVGLLLNSTRKLFKYASDFSIGHTGHEEKQHDLSSLHIGIVGLGGVGTRIAEILRNGFNTKISYFSKTRKENEEKRLGISYLSFDLLLDDVDVLIIMTPSTPQTVGMIGQSQINKMKNGVLIINSARPEIIDANALLSGLESGQIEYAAFDGFYEATSPEVEKLKSLVPQKLMVTGHIASLTHEARDGMAKLATQSIINLIKSGNDKYVVNKK
jgi:lactate dehydrogenase-like 2-hydroxyacid dehydrogenase